MTIQRQKELLQIVHRIGMAVTQLQSGCYTEQVAVGKIETLRISLDRVRQELCNEPTLQTEHQTQNEMRD